MKNIPKEWLALLVIIILTLGIGIYDWNKTQLKEGSGQSSIKLEKEEGDVTVVVEYLKDKSTANNMIFQITLDTHSVNLDAFDFQKEITLEKGGESFSPKVISQEGSVHHRKAEIYFEKASVPFEVVVMNLSDIPRREFVFNNF